MRGGSLSIWKSLGWFAQDDVRRIGVQRYLRRHVIDGVSHFSFLRPMTEIAIASRFARHPTYLPLFRSCNSAFRQALEPRLGGWCCSCPKCQFGYLALAPFVAKPQLVATFGCDMLVDEAQIDGFAELCGLRAPKPFECVGGVEESAATILHLVKQPDWQDSTYCP